MRGLTLIFTFALGISTAMTGHAVPRNKRESVPLDGSQILGRSCTVDSAHVATLSDCQALLNDPAAFAAAYDAKEATCAYITGEGYVHSHQSRTVARKGNCALAYATPANQTEFNASQAKTLAQAKSILKCGANAGQDKISARRVFKDGHALCLLEGDADCGCFDSLLMTPYGPPSEK